MEKSGVYIIKLDQNDDDEIFKIGVTRDIEARAASLQTASPFENLIIGFAYVDNANELESYIHNLFSDCRMRGEWFYLDPYQVREALVIIHEHAVVYGRYYSMLCDRLKDLNEKLMVPEIPMPKNDYQIPRYIRYISRFLFVAAPIYSIFMGSVFSMMGMGIPSVIAYIFAAACVVTFIVVGSP